MAGAQTTEIKGRRILRDMASLLFCRRSVFTAFVLSLCILPFAGKPVSAQVPAQFPAGPIGYWNLNENSGAVIGDSSGNGITGTWADSTDNAITSEAVTGINRGGLDFERDQQSRISFGTPASFANLDELSICAWIRPETLVNGQYFTILGKTSASGGDGWSFYVNGATRELGFQSRRYGYKEVHTPRITAGVWHHVCVTSDGSEGYANILLYINGVPNNNLGSYDDWSASVYDDSTRPLMISHTLAAARTDGMLDDVVAYNRVLTPEEILSLYEFYDDIRITSANLVGHWGFDSVSGSNQFFDLSGYGNTATAANDGWELVAGTNRNALDLHATENTTVLASGSGSLNRTGQVTYAAWIMDGPADGRKYIAGKNGKLFTLERDNQRLCFELYSGAYAASCSSYNFEPWKWYHVAMTFDDPSNTLRFYVDGVRIGTNTVTEVLSAAPGDAFYVGDGNGAYNLARLDDLRVYDGVLSDQDIRTLYNMTPCPGGPTGAGVEAEMFFNRTYRVMQYCNGSQWVSMGKDASALHGTTAGGLVGWWGLDETAGGTAVDQTGNNNLTYTGISASSETHSGPVGSAINISTGEGNGRYIGSNTISSDLTGLRTFTVSAWVNATSDPATTAALGIVEIPGIFRLQKSATSDRLGFIAEGWTTPGGRLSAATGMYNSWTHVVVVYSYDDPVGTNPRFYVNGVSSAASGSTPPAGTYVPSPSTILQIGNRSGAANASFQGMIDDVRIYNYALSEDEITELYQSSDGSYVPAAVTFNGSSNYLNVSGVTTPVGSSTVTGSFWVRKAVANSSGRIFEFGGSDHTVWVNQTHIAFAGFNASGTVYSMICQTDEGAININDTEWHHVMWSFDLSDQNRKHIYVDGINALPGACNIYVEGSDFLFNTSGNIGMGAGQYFNGNVADFWFDMNTYVDLSVESNRRRFVSASGEARYLGANGELPTGDAPEIFLSGSAATWHNNRGTLGGFNVNGPALTVAPTGPAGGADMMPRYCSLPEQPAGTLVFNSDDNVMQYCDGARWIPLNVPGAGGMGCSNPPGEVGEIVYNADHHVMQYCDGGAWYAAASSPQ